MHTQNNDIKQEQCTKCGDELSGRSWHSVCSKCVLQQVMYEGDAVESARANGQVPPGSDTETALRSKLEHGIRYRDEREHARGGMGRILIAQDDILGREVAIKELAGEVRTSSEDACPKHPHKTSLPFNSRFIREARIAGQLEHPAIVPVHELGTREDGTLYYTMKYVRGVSLSEAMEEADGLEGRLKLLPHILDVCQAVAYAHSRGVIHRDIKPANIMVGSFGETVLLDWGLARVKGEVEERIPEIDPEESPVDTGAELDSGWTSRGEVLGTPAYMAPEQASGNIDAVGERSDVYGLGTLLYVALTGEAPYKGKNRRETLDSVRTAKPTPIRELAPTAPAELTAICNKAMARDPEQRYESASQVAEELQQFLTGGRVTAHEYRFSEHMRRFARKNSGVLATPAVAIVSLIALGIGSYFRVIGERNAAITAREETQGYLEQSQINLDLANENLALAQGAVDALLIDVSGNELLNRPEMEPVRRKMLESALEHCERLAKQKPSDNPDSLAQVSDAQYRLGEVYELLGLYPEAIAAYGQASDGFSTLFRASSDTVAQRELMYCLRRQGELYRQLGLYDEALDAYRQAETGLETLAADGHPNTLGSQADLAAVRWGLGLTFGEMGLTGKALHQFEQARESFVVLSQAQPDWYEVQALLADSLQSVGLAHRTLGNPEEAITALESALGLWRGLARELPEDARYTVGIVTTSHALGIIFDGLGRHNEFKNASQDSMEFYKNELSVQLGLVKARPDVPTYQISLAKTHANIGAFHRRLGNLSEALNRYEEARDIATALVEIHPNIPEYQATLAALWDGIGATQMKLGANEEALAAWERAGALYATLSEAYVGVPKYRTGLAANWSNLARVHEILGQNDQAQAARMRANELSIEPTGIRTVPGGPTE